MNTDLKLNPLLDKLDITVNRKEGQRVVPVGLCIRFSVHRNCWIAGYGAQAGVLGCTGATADEALYNLVEKVNTPIS